MEFKKVSNKLLSRFPVYLNYLRSLPESCVNISATKIAAALNLGDVLVRKDLAQISSGGRRKLGYDREGLIHDIEEFLEVNCSSGLIIVGAGRLGSALLNYDGFRESGMQVLAGFDLCGTGELLNNKVPIYNMECIEEFCKNNDVLVGIISVPKEEAQDICDRLVSCGIRAIWNFAPVRLNVPEKVVVRNEDLTNSLTTLRMELKVRENFLNIS